MDEGSEFGDLVLNTGNQWMVLQPEGALVIYGPSLGEHCELIHGATRVRCEDR